jgi:hypothetical protein
VRPLVFLHIPKTAGQTVHNALVEAVGGARHVSPVRTHTEAPPEAQMPPGFRLYSGHLDWTHLDAVPGAPFVFSVLRDPRERIASFYLYLRSEAERMPRAALMRPENLGKRMIRERSADDYFFGGDGGWQAFVKDHYDNFYCSYFATRRMRGRPMLAGLDDATVIRRAMEGLGRLDGVYPVSDLARLEDDVASEVGGRPAIAARRDNPGPVRPEASRWKALAARFENDGSEARLQAFAGRDEALMRRLGPGFC